MINVYKLGIWPLGLCPEYLGLFGTAENLFLATCCLGALIAVFWWMNDAVYSHGVDSFNASLLETCFAVKHIKLVQSIAAGEAGTPLIFPDSPSHLERGNPSFDIVVGISSFGEKTCKEDGKPAVFTCVSDFSDWIEKTIKSVEAGLPVQPEVGSLMDTSLQLPYETCLSAFRMISTTFLPRSISWSPVNLISVLGKCHKSCIFMHDILCRVDSNQIVELVQVWYMYIFRHQMWTYRALLWRDLQLLDQHHWVLQQKVL